MTTSGHISHARTLQPDFGELTIVGIYARWTLDCIVEVATAIAQDYRKRYREYRRVDAPLAEILANVYSKMGYDPAYPDTAQRTAINMPLLGSSDAQASADTSPFYQSALNLRKAAVAYSERVYNTGEPMLRQAFIDAARQLHAYLSTLDGGVIDRARQDTETIFRQSVRVLKSAEVAGAFGGLPAAPADNWPLPGTIDEGKYLSGDGAYLMEAVSSALQPPNGLMTQQRFLAVQRVAVSGARTIQRIVNEEYEAEEGAETEVGDGNGDGDGAERGHHREVRHAISTAYSWATALRDLEAAIPQAK